MKIVFAGTPEFARLAMSAILEAGHEVPLVMTQPDRPSGRGLKLTSSAVKQGALEAGIPVIQPRGLRLDGKYAEEAAQVRDALLAVQPDLMVVAAYGLILPKWVLELPRHGCFNIHASLLPRWRGAAPIQRAIEAGDLQTGICIMQMDEGLDTGDVLLRRALPITPAHTAAGLHDELAVLGGRAIVQAIAELEAGALKPEPQPAEGVTYAAKLEKAEGLLDVSQPAAVLARRIRAFNPVPGAAVTLPGLDQPVKVWQAEQLPRDARTGAPGQVLSVSPEGVDIATGEGVLRLLNLQKAGGKRLPVADFVRGWDYKNSL
ncbi:methionyl-tRNA formyltransferase [Pusillimonas sp. CC-YST705]|uniref:Methionyl-tRNA formyltransferase n=1 Tax=Mesopusillimonas faecipullorum TaxID=2755040 RepID=A0ABS8C9J4_9BURK|nr:methionyl-tRNA formyltransferase [Mesopusillimonas faecipullorum]MCB5362700.1 methionyl-tRNA formyltransferase [Mesopusillimonas faecipullorum]